MTGVSYLNLSCLRICPARVARWWKITAASFAFPPFNLGATREDPSNNNNNEKREESRESSPRRGDGSRSTADDCAGEDGRMKGTMY